MEIVVHAVFIVGSVADDHSVCCTLYVPEEHIGVF
jgi:hypothetical protein